MAVRSAFERPSGALTLGAAGGFSRAHHLRYADLRTGLEALVALGALAVDAHLAGPQQLLQVRVADVRKVDAEPPVEAHVRLVRLNFDGFHAIVHKKLECAARVRPRNCSGRHAADENRLYPFRGRQG